MGSTQSTWGVTSEQDCRNMNRFVVSCSFLAVAMGAPSHVAVGSLGYAGQVVSAPVAHAPAVVGQTHHSYAAAGVEHIPQPATSYVAGAPQNLVETRALPAPVIPAAPAPYAAIPPAPVPAGPAPADTVTQTRIAAPVRSHTRITPQVTNIVPEVQVHKYNVDVPVAVPRAVPREIIVEQKVAKPYEVPVPRAVPVPAPYKVHPVQEIVETPYIHHQTVETHSTQAVVTAHATPVHAVAHAPVAVAHAAPAVAAGYSYGVGYAAAAAPVAAVAGHYAAAPAATAVIA